MKDIIGLVTSKMIDYEAGSPHRINHFLKVYGFAKAIGELEGLEEEDQLILEIASLMHDIGIKPSLEKYGSAEGKYQELEGPIIAKKIFEGLSLGDKIEDRVSFLIGHHHSYDDIRGLDYQILVEADFLVNIFEGEYSQDRIRTIEETIFKTATGKKFLDRLFYS